MPSRCEKITIFGTAFKIGEGKGKKRSLLEGGVDTPEKKGKI